MGRLHWSDKPLHESHAWRKDGHCEGCMMHNTWAGSRDACSNRVERPPKQASPLPREASSIEDDAEPIAEMLELLEDGFDDFDAGE